MRQAATRAIKSGVFDCGNDSFATSLWESDRSDKAHWKSVLRVSMLFVKVHLKLGETGPEIGCVSTPNPFGVPVFTEGNAEKGCFRNDAQLAARMLHG